MFSVVSVTPVWHILHCVFVENTDKEDNLTLDNICLWLTRFRLVHVYMGKPVCAGVFACLCQ